MRGFTHHRETRPSESLLKGGITISQSLMSSAIIEKAFLITALLTINHYIDLAI